MLKMKKLWVPKSETEMQRGEKGEGRGDSQIEGVSDRQRLMSSITYNLMIFGDVVGYSYTISNSYFHFSVLPFAKLVMGKILFSKTAFTIFYIYILILIF